MSFNTVQFNCLYRWHATTSSKDEVWVNDMMKDIFKDKPLDDVTAQDFKAVGAKLHSMGQDLTHWTFGGMNRTEDGSFDDAALAKVLFDSYVILSLFRSRLNAISEPRILLPPLVHVEHRVRPRTSRDQVTF